MKHAMPCVLTINGGSSSIRFAIYGPGEKGTGKLGRVVLTGTNLTVDDPTGKAINFKPVAARSYATAVDFLPDWLNPQPSFTSVKAAGHRVVRGMIVQSKKHSEPERITPKLLAELHQITAYDPGHLPRGLALTAPSGRSILSTSGTWSRETSWPGRPSRNSRRQRRATIQSRQFHPCADSPLPQPGTFEPGERSGVYQ
jgi:hypothetical protein